MATIITATIITATIITATTIITLVAEPVADVKLARQINESGLHADAVFE